MVEKIEIGTILIEEGVLFPDSLRAESEPYLNGWRVVKELDGYGLDRKMSEAGWTCFHMAEEIKGSAVALDGEKSLCKAVNQILTKLEVGKIQLPGDYRGRYEAVSGTTPNDDHCPRAPYSGKDVSVRLDEDATATTSACFN